MFQSMATQNIIKFSFYGFGIEVRCQDIETLQNIQRDYSFFLSDRVNTRVFFEIFNEPPDYSKFSSIKAYLYTANNICYRQKDFSFVDYFGKGLVTIDHRKNIYRVFCSDPNLRHEIVFLFIMALAGQDFDFKNIHRVHGLGIEANNKGILVLLPSGGGKTTLLMSLIKDKSVKLISEDSPLIDASGKIYPFPIRIGVSYNDKPQDISDEHLHLIKRMGFGPKYVIDINVFKDKIVQKPIPLQYIFCGVRCLGNESYIKSISKYGALKELIKNSVAGEGLCQGDEFLLPRGILRRFKKSPILFSRLKNACNAVLRAKTYYFVIGSDRKKNVETFLNFFK